MCDVLYRVLPKARGVPLSNPGVCPENSGFRSGSNDEGRRLALEERVSGPEESQTPQFGWRSASKTGPLGHRMWTHLGLIVG